MRAALLAVFIFASCANVTPVEQGLVDCASAAGQSLAAPLIGQVQTLLQSGQINWQNSLDSLLTSAGIGVVCAVQSVVKDLEGGATITKTQEVALIRGTSWLSSEGHSKLTTYGDHSDGLRGNQR